MAFTGTATIKQVSDSIVRITGLSLGAGPVSGTIGLHTETGGAPDVVLPVGFQPLTYQYGNVPGLVSLQDSITVDVYAAGAVTNALQVSVVKTGTTPADFRATVTNSSGSASPALEMYVKFHQ